MTTATTLRHEVEIDTAIAINYEAEARERRNVELAMGSMHYAVDRQTRKGSEFTWGLSDEEVLSATPEPWRQRAYDQGRAKYDAARSTLRVLRSEREVLDAQYTGWSRFFLVTSSAGGHIHRSMGCSTCTYTTTYGWLPQLSGLTEADAVADQGPRLCSVCYPSAPVEWTVGEPKPAKDYCPGSDKPVVNAWQRRYSQCPDCGKTVSHTKYGHIRKHVA